MTTAAEVLELLRSHYISPSKPSPGYFAPEIQAPNSMRRADLIWLPLTSYQRGEIVGHEIKVSRADVIAELSDPTKADAWAQYCTEWWLVVADPALIEGLTVPHAWGVMAPPSGRRRRSMTIIKQATKLSPSGQTEALATLMARMFNAGDDVEARLRWLEAERARLSDDATKWHERYREMETAHRAVTIHPHEAEQIRDVLREIVNITRKPGPQHYLAVRPETIAMAAVDLEYARRQTSALINAVSRRIYDFERALEAPSVAHITEGLHAIERKLKKASQLELPDMSGAGQ